MGKLQLFYKNVRNKLKNTNGVQQQLEQCCVGESECCTEQFISTMKRHSEKVLGTLSDLSKDVNEAYNILDITGGNGENLAILSKHFLDAYYTLVEGSSLKINRAKARLGDEVTYINRNRMQYLRVCEEKSFDIILCIWPYKIMDIKELIKECVRILKPGGKLVMIMSLKDTLPEIITLYHKLFIKYSEKIHQIKRVDTLPASVKDLDKLIVKEGLTSIMYKEAKHILGFASSNKLVEWLITTGIMKDYEEVLALQDEAVKKSLMDMLEETKIEWITHRFAYGIWEKI